ncbi:acylphosphatase, partial [Streptococcus ruminantium]|nr:acylphosphatase [Streptococcus ruminantium]MDQ8781260.1 acylphosphatase [Streptococcus ruminantium]
EIRKGPSRMSKVNYLDITLANFEDYHDFQVSHR